MEYLSTCGLVRTTCHRSYMWHRRDVILIQEGVHVVLFPPVDQRPVPLYPGFAGERRCRRVMLHVREERLTRSTGRRVIQTPRREAFGTVGAGMPHFSCRCPGGIPAGMGALEFCVGTIILERDKRMSIKNKNRSMKVPTK